MPQLTKKSHYNPCFWTALWNESYFTDHCAGKSTLHAREQVVFTLNVRSNKILQTKVENIFYYKDVGAAEMSPESMVHFAKRHFPDRAEEILKYVTEHPDTLILDFESTLTALEHNDGYEAIMRAVRQGTLESAIHRGFLALELMIHMMRSHEFMSILLVHPSPFGLDAWESLWMLKNAWANRSIMARAAVPLFEGQWTLWRTDKHSFPCCDSPVMIDENSLLAALSPRLLLHIDLDSPQPEDQWLVRDGIPETLVTEFRKRCLRNTFKDLAFPDEQLLRTWQESPDYQTRLQELGSPTSRHTQVHEAAGRALWAIGGFGRVPSDFDEQAKKIFDQMTDKEREGTRLEWERGRRAHPIAAK